MPFASDEEYQAWKAEKRIARMVRSCLVKKRFKNMTQARISAWYIYRSKNQEMYGYRCEVCNGYHHTSGEYDNPKNIVLITEMMKESLKSGRERVIRQCDDSSLHRKNRINRRKGKNGY